MTKKLVTYLFVMLLCMPFAQATFVPDERPSAEVESEQQQCQHIVNNVGVGNYEGLSVWLRTHLEPDREAGNSSPWKYPLDTLIDGKGVCKDYALLVVECLTLMGVKDVFFLGVLNTELTSGHAVAIFRTNKEGPWYFYSFDRLVMGPRKFRRLVECVGYKSGYGLYPVYYLFNKDLTLITPDKEPS